MEQHNVDWTTYMVEILQDLLSICLDGEQTWYSKIQLLAKCEPALPIESNETIWHSSA